MQSLCARREYSSSDILAKAIKALDGDTAEAGLILEALLKDGFVDDSRYALAYTREKAEISGWGPAKIAYALHAKGISREMADEAYRQINSEKADDKLVKALKAKSRSLKDTPQKRAKLFRFAAGRGYSYDSINKALAELSIDESGTDDITF